MLTKISKKCVVCNAEALLEAEFEDIKLYRCLNCRHCFTDTDSLNFFQEYNNQYYETNWSRNPNYKLFNFISRRINKLCPSGLILEVGCGRGDFLEYLRKTNPKLVLTGIDLSQQELNGIKFIRGDFLQIDFQKSYDIIVSLVVIEHIVDVQKFAAKLHQMLKPSGYAIIMTIDEQGFLYWLARKLRDLGYRYAFERLYSRHHLNHFNAKSLDCLLTKQGFSKVELFHHNIPLECVDSGLNSFMGVLAKIGLFFIFLAGKFTKKSYLQTVIYRRN
jgi:SAM-dependent methyltransferase